MQFPEVPPYVPGPFIKGLDHSLSQILALDPFLGPQSLFWVLTPWFPGPHLLKDCLLFWSKTEAPFSWAQQKASFFYHRLMEKEDIHISL